MQISELDEFEGLTAEMVRTWLLAKGCTQEPGHWRHPDGQLRYKDGDYGGLLWSQSIYQIAVDFGLSVQSLLREMNPRMRNGLPSEAAREEHGGRWIASRREEYTHTTIVRFLRGLTVKLQYEDHRTTYDPTHEIEKWSFWPCDANGNKVPWPKVRP
jgi:hypothetical protein